MKKTHDAWDPRGPGKQDVYNGLVVRLKQDMTPIPLRTPHMGSHHHRKQFLVSDGLVCTQAPLNHSLLKYAPKLKEPAVSDVTSRSVGADIPGNNQKLTPCHEVRKSCHHCTSS